MEQVYQGNNIVTPPTMPVKRKRGRPRKDQSLLHRGAVSAPPGFAKVNRTQPCQKDSVENLNDGIVGQAVVGVVEAAFDAGYLLTVKIGNSNTSLRGVVFKPGHYVPISPENDVAPHVHMIRRNEIPFSTHTVTPIHGHHPRSREGKEQHSYLLNGSPPVNEVHKLDSLTYDPVLAKAKVGSLVPTHGVPSVGSRGTMVPVVLEPVTNLNGLPVANEVPPISSEGGQTTVASHKQVALEGVQNDNSPKHQGAMEALFGEEVKSTKPSTPDDITKRAEVPSQSPEAHTEDSLPGVKSSAEDSGISPEGESDGVSEPLVIEPLQVIHSVPKPFENKSIGRMSELLQAVQQNMMENLISVETQSKNADQGDEESQL